MDRRADGWTDGWTDEWMDGWMDGWTNGWMDGWTNGWMDGWTDRRADGWIDGWIDGWGQMNIQTGRQTNDEQTDKGQILPMCSQYCCSVILLVQYSLRHHRTKLDLCRAHTCMPHSYACASLRIETNHCLINAHCIVNPRNTETVISHGGQVFRCGW